MSPTLDRLMACAVSGLSLLLVALLGGLAWKAFHDAAAASSLGAAQAAEDLRLLGALILVVVAFLVGILAMGAAQFRGASRQPLRELVEGLGRIGRGGARERIVPQGPSEIRAAIAAANDVAASLADQQAQLTRAVTMGTIDALINGVAHEVHTPLTPLLLDAHLLGQVTRRLAAREDVPADVRVALERSLRLNERTQAGLGRLGRLSRALREVARGDRTAAPRDLNLIVTAVLALTRHRMPAGADLVARLEAARPVSCVAWDVFYALYELVLHIADALREQETLEVWTRDEAGMVCLGIRTDAHVLPRAAIEALEAAQGQAPDGGLVGARAALEAAGAHVSFRSDLQWGTEWHIVLPQHRDAPGAEAAGVLMHAPRPAA